MPVLYLNGTRLKNVVIAAAGRVLQMQEVIDNINVFPVPDADTGTNMSLTLRHVAEGALSCKGTSLDKSSTALAEAAFSGAHGSSGAILAQFFQGLAEAFHGHARADLRTFARASRVATDMAYRAVAEPREGTILTVMREWSAFLEERCEASGGFAALLRDSLGAATASLARTPLQLPALARAGVIDAGGQAFVCMLQGIVEFTESGKFQTGLGTQLAAGGVKALVGSQPELLFQFCMQARLAGIQVEHEQIKAQLGSMGDSLIVSGSGGHLHLHIHTNHPQQVLGMVGQFGTVLNSSAEDMRSQSAQAHRDSAPHTIALITDSSCDLPADELIRHKIRVAHCRVMFGQTSYLDKVTITNRDFYEIFASSQVSPRTAHPSPADYRDALLSAAATHEEALIICLSGALSGAFQAARLACEGVENQFRAVAIDSRNISAGLGLVVRDAAAGVESGATLEELRSRIESAIRNVRIFAGVPTVEYLIRSGRLSGLRGGLARLMKLSPIISLDSQGRARVVARALGAAHGRRKLLQLVERAAAGQRNIRFLVAHSNDPGLGSWYARRIQARFGVENVSIVSISAALGSHLGPGAALIAMLGDYEAGVNRPSPVG